MDPSLVQFAANVIDAEAAAVGRMREAVRAAGFAEAVDVIFDCGGSIVCTGVGKAGHIARKISATLASTGTPSHYLNPADALHGDLGSARDGDVLLAFSFSGESAEIVNILQAVKRLGNPVLAITRSDQSTLGRHADVVVPMGGLDEACALRLAPSCSTTAMLALGDALALTISHAKNFGPDDFARYHPAGALGRRLMKVHEAMTFTAGTNLPTAGPDETVAAALSNVSTISRRPGAICVVSDAGQLLGVFSDGDLRRLLLAGPDALQQPIAEVMTRQPKHVATDALAAEALAIMHRHRIDELPVLDGGGLVVGLIDIQDLTTLQAAGT
jgi:arabinose-5-phosphate isomerase